MNTNCYYGIECQKPIPGWSAHSEYILSQSVFIQMKVSQNAIMVRDIHFFTSCPHLLPVLLCHLHTHAYVLELCGLSPPENSMLSIRLQPNRSRSA